MSYMGEFRSEMRDLVRGVFTDLVKESVTLEMRLGSHISALKDDNAMLRAEVQELRLQMERLQRFGLGGISSFL